MMKNVIFAMETWYKQIKYHMNDFISFVVGALNFLLQVKPPIHNHT